MRGKILSTIAGVYNVLLENNEIVSITPRGVFRHKKIKPSVGDDVIVENNIITQILPRKNDLIRPNISNLDLGVIVVSMVKPEYSSYLLDKFLTYLNMNKVQPLIILSKCDLCNDNILIEKIKAEYKLLGIKVIAYSSKTQEGIEEIKTEIENKLIAFMGQTGVGKSSLINIINPEFDRQIGEYSKALNRGKHQTKEVKILPYKNTLIADTPGFSSLEITCFKEELKDYFPFFKIKHDDCFFLDCMHINEPKCEIKKLINNQISQEHYDNYISIFNELIYRKDRFK